MTIINLHLYTQKKGKVLVLKHQDLLLKIALSFFTRCNPYHLGIRTLLPKQ